MLNSAVLTWRAVPCHADLSKPFSRRSSRRLGQREMYTPAAVRWTRASHSSAQPRAIHPPRVPLMSAELPPGPHAWHHATPCHAISGSHTSCGYRWLAVPTDVRAQAPAWAVTQPRCRLPDSMNTVSPCQVGCVCSCEVHPQTGSQPGRCMCWQQRSRAGPR